MHYRPARHSECANQLRHVSSALQRSLAEESLLSTVACTSWSAHRSSLSLLYSSISLVASKQLFVAHLAPIWKPVHDRQVRPYQQVNTLAQQQEHPAQQAAALLGTVRLTATVELWTY